jgi:hypothetical protein
MNPAVAGQRQLTKLKVESGNKVRTAGIDKQICSRTAIQQFEDYAA